MLETKCYRRTCREFTGQQKTTAQGHSTRLQKSELGASCVCVGQKCSFPPRLRPLLPVQAAGTAAVFVFVFLDQIMVQLSGGNNNRRPGMGVYTRLGHSYSFLGHRGDTTTHPPTAILSFACAFDRNPLLFAPGPTLAAITSSKNRPKVRVDKTLAGATPHALEQLSPCNCGCKKGRFVAGLGRGAISAKPRSLQNVAPIRELR